jgi:hypothetical protein
MKGKERGSGSEGVKNILFQNVCYVDYFKLKSLQEV